MRKEKSKRGRKKGGPGWVSKKKRGGKVGLGPIGDGWREKYRRYGNREIRRK